MEKFKNIKECKEFIKRANKFRYVTIFNAEMNEINIKNKVRNKVMLRRGEGKDNLIIKYNIGYQKYIIELMDNFIEYMRYEEFDEGLSLKVYPFLIIFNARPNIERVTKNNEDNKNMYETFLGEESTEIYEWENDYDAIAVDRLDDYEINFDGKPVPIRSEEELLNYLNEVKQYEYVTIFKDLPKNQSSWHNARLINIGIDKKRESSYNSIYLENDVTTEKIVNKNRFDILFHEEDIEKANIIAYMSPENYKEEPWDYSILKIKNTIFIFHKYYILEKDIYKENKQNVTEFKYDSPLYIKVKNGSEILYLPDIDECIEEDIGK